MWIVVLILALANVVFDVSGFIAGLGVMGFVVGFAVKDVLSNLAAGLFEELELLHIALLASRNGLENGIEVLLGRISLIVDRIPQLVLKR